MKIEDKDTDFLKPYIKSVPGWDHTVHVQNMNVVHYPNDAMGGSPISGFSRPASFGDVIDMSKFPAWAPVISCNIPFICYSKESFAKDKDLNLYARYAISPDGYLLDEYFCGLKSSDVERRISLVKAKEGWQDLIFDALRPSGGGYVSHIESKIDYDFYPQEFIEQCKPHFNKLEDAVHSNFFLWQNEWDKK